LKPLTLENMEHLPDKKHDLLNKLVDPGMLSAPPENFTGSVMNKLGIVPVKNSISFKPVISRKGWIFIGLTILTIFVFALTGTSPAEQSATGLKSEIIARQVNNSFASAFTNPGMIYYSSLAFAVFLVFLAESKYRQSRLKLINV